MATTLGTEAIPAPFRWEGEHLAIDLRGARARFTTRRGGFSKDAFATLNLGRLTKDDPDAVTQNRAKLQSHVDGRLAMIRQVHGTRVVRLTAADQACGPAPQGDLEEADGQATPLRGIAPIVLTADCLPVVLAGGGTLAVLHAGWRGLADGIIQEGVRALKQLGTTPRTLVAAIGPGAGACCYEVGDEVHERFRAYGARARRGQNLDMKAIARDQLTTAGIPTVHDVGLCTICSSAELFFSHRRDRGITGRQAGIAWLT
jgi:YfiH family protein